MSHLEMLTRMSIEHHIMKSRTMLHWWRTISFKENWTNRSAWICQSDRLIQGNWVYLRTFSGLESNSPGAVSRKPSALILHLSNLNVALWAGVSKFWLNPNQVASAGGNQFACPGQSIDFGDLCFRHHPHLIPCQTRKKIKPVYDCIVCGHQNADYDIYGEQGRLLVEDDSYSEGGRRTAPLVATIKG